jgi:hypothetical protein
LSIPILESVFSGSGLEQNFHKFDEFVLKAQASAIKEGRTYLLVWHDDVHHDGGGGLTLEAESPSAEEADAQPPEFSFGNAKVTITRPFSLVDKPPAVWPFWRSGTCEAVRITYEGADGRWIADYDPLTARGTIVEMHD